jgi:hypothetical protein
MKYAENLRNQNRSAGERPVRSEHRAGEPEIAGF